MASSNRNLNGSIRKSCDRCHSFKLRCQRLVGEERCERCLKQDASCRYSPKEPRRQAKRVSCTVTGNEAVVDHAVAPSLRPLGTASHIPVSSKQSITLVGQTFDAETTDLQPSYQYHKALHIAQTADLMSGENFLGPDWSTSCNSGYNADAINAPHNTTNFPDIFLPTLEEMLVECTSDDANEGRQTSKGEYEQAIWELGVLNTALFEHASKLPSYTLAAGSETPALTPRTTGFAALKPSNAAKVYIIEEMFTLTKSFIEVMRKLLSMVNQPSDSFPLPDYEFLEHDHLRSQEPLGGYMPESQVSRNEAQPKFLSLDDAAVLLILSCYCRIVDVHKSVFEKIQACLQSRSKWVLDENSSVELPHLHIGSYSPSAIDADARSSASVDRTSFVPFSTAAMYMMMIVMLSEDLHSQLRDVMLSGLGIENPCDSIASSCEGGQAMDFQADEQTGAASASPPQHELADTVKRTVSRRTERLAKSLDETKKMLQQNAFVPC